MPSPCRCDRIPSLTLHSYLTLDVCFASITIEEQLHLKINTNNRPYFLAAVCLISPVAHLYHLSHGISGAEEEKEGKPFFENYTWRKFIALEET